MQLIRVELNINKQTCLGLLSAAWMYDLLSQDELETVDKTLVSLSYHSLKHDTKLYFTPFGLYKLLYWKKIILRNAHLKNIPVEWISKKVSVVDEQIIYQNECTVIASDKIS